MAHSLRLASSVASNPDVLGIRGLPENGVDASPLAGRISYAFISSLSLALVSGLFSVRIHRLTLRRMIRLPLIRLYLLTVYFWGICFIMAASIMRSGFQVTNVNQCLAAIILCLVFYVVDKVLMYLFLVERVYVVRRRRRSRGQDRWYLLNMAIIALGFGTIAVFSFMFPVAEVSTADGKCRIGLPFKITLPLLIYDVTINVYLTAHFVYFARPQIVKWSPKDLFHRDSESKISYGSNSGQRSRDTTLERVARRTLKGMCVMLLGTSINLAILFHMRGREQYWECFTFCTMDVAVGIVTLHWITSDPSEKQLGRSENDQQTNTLHYYTSGPPRHAVADSMSLAEITNPATCDARAWADKRDTITVPDKILVTTTYSCHDDDMDVVRNSKPPRASSELSSLDERLVTNEEIK